MTKKDLREIMLADGRYGGTETVNSAIETRIRRFKESGMTDEQALDATIKYVMKTLDKSREYSTRAQIEDFMEGLDKTISQVSAVEMLKLYDENFEIKFLGKTIFIPFDAVSYDAIENALKTIKAEL